MTGGLTLDTGTTDFGEGAVLTFQGSQSLIGNGTLSLASVTGKGGIAVASGATLTIAPGITVEGNSGAVGSSSAGVPWDATARISGPSAGRAGRLPSKYDLGPRGIWRHEHLAQEHEPRDRCLEQSLVRASDHVADFFEFAPSPSEPSAATPQTQNDSDLTASNYVFPGDSLYGITDTNAGALPTNQATQQFIGIDQSFSFGNYAPINNRPGATLLASILLYAESTNANDVNQVSVVPLCNPLEYPHSIVRGNSLIWELIRSSAGASGGKSG